MKIQFKQAMFTGTRSYAANEVAEFPDTQATTILNRGFAVAVKDEPKLESADKPTESKPADAPPVIQTATIQPPVVETATKRKGH